MRKHRTALTVTAATLALAAALTASPATALPSTSHPSATEPTEDLELSCSADGATGAAQLRIERIGTPSTGYQHRATVTAYKIDYPGQSGSSANVNLGLVGSWDAGPGSTETWWNSRDEMIQDGRWHDRLTLAGPLVGAVPGPTGQAIRTTVEFVFDKSGGSDPRCRTTRTTVH